MPSKRKIKRYSKKWKKTKEKAKVTTEKIDQLIPQAKKQVNKLIKDIKHSNNKVDDQDDDNKEEPNKNEQQPSNDDKDFIICEFPLNSSTVELNKPQETELTQQQHEQQEELKEEEQEQELKEEEQEEFDDDIVIVDQEDGISPQNEIPQQQVTINIDNIKQVKLHLKLKAAELQEMADSLKHYASTLDESNALRIFSLINENHPEIKLPVLISGESASSDVDGIPME